MTDRDYLLGRLAEEDGVRLEEELLNDHETYGRVRASEDDLIDEYASGRMSDTDRRDFERSPLANRERIVFARALSMRTPMRAQPSNVVAFHGSRVALAAAAMLVVAVAAIFFASRREPLGPLTAPPVAKKVEPPATAPLRVVAITLAIGRARSDASEPNVATIAPDIAAVQLRVRIHPDDVYDSYSVELRSGDTVAWRGTARAQVTDGGRLLIADIPASSLRAGRYEIAVRGDEEPLGFETLEVRR